MFKNEHATLSMTDERIIIPAYQCCVSRDVMEKGVLQAVIVQALCTQLKERGTTQAQRNR